MKKRVLALLIALSLAAVPPVYAAEDKVETEAAEEAVSEQEAETETTDEAASEQEAETETADEAASEQEPDTEPSDEAESEQKYDLNKALSELSEEDLDEYLQMLEGMDKREALENVLVVKQTLESEEFARLMEYPEMQALIDEVLKKAEKFIIEEPELMGKILVTMGLNEKIVNVLVALIKE